jgi:hypothetical protein
VLEDPKPNPKHAPIHSSSPDEESKPDTSSQSDSKDAGSEPNIELDIGLDIGKDGDRPSIQPDRSSEVLIVDRNLDAYQIEQTAQMLALDERRMHLKVQTVKLKTYEQDEALFRKARLIQQLTHGMIGVVVLTTGIAFTAAEQMIGPYLMGVGVAAASFSLKDVAQSRHPSLINQQDES